MSRARMDRRAFKKRRCARSIERQCRDTVHGFEKFCVYIGIDTATAHAIAAIVPGGGRTYIYRHGPHADYFRRAMAYKETER